MKVKMYTVYDQKAETHNSPLCYQTVGQALRAFTDAANDPNSAIAKHPEDYTLLEIGTFDDSRGTVEPHDKPHLIGSANQYITQE